jgi:hypothetical protein
VLLRRASLATAVLIAAQSLLGAMPASAEEPAPKPPAIATPGGVPVTFMSRQASTIIYLAHGDMPAHTEPDPFEKIGVAPQSIRLSPGTYTVETSGPTQTDGHQVFVVEHDAPLTVEVHPGDPTLKLLGGTLIALGVACIALGIVAILSISKDDSQYNRWGIGLPLSLGGAGGVVVGFTMAAMGSTDVHVPHLPPGTARPSAAGPMLTVRF